MVPENTLEDDKENKENKENKANNNRNKVDTSLLGNKLRNSINTTSSKLNLYSKIFTKEEDSIYKTPS